MKYLFLVIQRNTVEYSYKPITITTNFNTAKQLAMEYKRKILVGYPLRGDIYIYQVAINNLANIELVSRIGVYPKEHPVRIIENEDPIFEFALKILEDDPLAIDAVKDILKS